MNKTYTILYGRIFSLLLTGSIGFVKAGSGPYHPKGFRPEINQPISFRENLGQVNDQNLRPRPDVLFSGTDGRLVYHLRNNGISYQLTQTDSIPFYEVCRVDVNWLNSRTNPAIQKGESLQGYDNFYTVKGLSGITNVRSYKEIIYRQIYDGIDLKWYAKENSLKYDYVVAPHADYKQIRLEIKGTEKISINSKGELVIQTPLGDIIEQAPLVEQGCRQIPSKWVIKDNTAAFDIQGINPDLPFTIDPAVRAWGTYYGGNGEIVQRFGRACATDASGNVYISGFTGDNTGIATTGSSQQLLKGTYNAFLVKFNAGGVRQWGTYYGEGDEHTGYCTTDGSGNVYLAGTTINTRMSAGEIHQPIHGGGIDDAWLAKFSAAGILQWTTYYGGEEIDLGFSCATDDSGNVYLAGTTKSATVTSIATPGSHQPTPAGNDDAFLVKFNASGIRQWATYYGGAGEESFPCVATDTSGNVYLSGTTTSNTGAAVATPGSHQPAFGGGIIDAFLAKFNASGVRQWATWYGGEGVDSSYSCITDVSGNVYLAGTSNSRTSIATAGSHQSIPGGNYDAFLVKFDSSGVRQWGTYYGGEETEGGYSCATDTSNNVYLAGGTASTTGTSIATAGSHQQVFGGGTDDAFLAAFSAAGVRQWGSYYGGEGADAGHACATDASGSIFMSGQTGSATGTSIATPGSHKAIPGESAGLYLVKFEYCTKPVTADIAAYADASCGVRDGSATASASGGNGDFVYTWLPLGGTGVSANNLPAGTYTLVVASGVCKDTATVLIKNGENNLAAYPGQPDTICPGASVSLGAHETTSHTYTWQPAAGLSCSNCPDPVAKSDTSITYQLIVTDSTGCSDTGMVTITVMLKPFVFAGNDTTITAGDSVTLLARGNGTYSYSWSTGETTVSVTVAPVDASVYRVTITDTNNCTSTDAVTILVAEPGLLVPNVFTPNGDMENDVFRILYSDGSAAAFNIILYNRWGVLVYEFDNSTNGWDGTTLAGEEATDGIYYYVLKAGDQNKVQYPEQGFITLVR